jgi:hypothetical protein
MLTTTGGRDGGGVLDALLDGIQPYVTVAAAMAEHPPAVVVVEVAVENVVVDVQHCDADGRRQGFEFPGDPPLADAVAAFLTAGLRRLDPSARARLSDLLAMGHVQLCVLVDPLLGTAQAAAVAPDGRRVDLFGLASEETRH